MVLINFHKSKQFLFLKCKWLFVHNFRIHSPSLFDKEEFTYHYAHMLSNPVCPSSTQFSSLTAQIQNLIQFRSWGNLFPSNCKCYLNQCCLNQYHVFSLTQTSFVPYKAIISSFSFKQALTVTWEENGIERIKKDSENNFKKEISFIFMLKAITIQKGKKKKWI